MGMNDLNGVAISRNHILQRTCNHVEGNGVVEGDGACGEPEAHQPTSIGSHGQTAGQSRLRELALQDLLKESGLADF